jgi:hypothetical protein
MSDRVFYDQVSCAAQEYSQRAEIDLRAQIESLEDIIRLAID